MLEKYVLNSYFILLFSRKIPTFSYFLMKIPTFSYFLELSYYLTPCICPYTAIMKTLSIPTKEWPLSQTLAILHLIVSLCRVMEDVIQMRKIK